MNCERKKSASAAANHVLAWTTIHTSGLPKASVHGTVQHTTQLLQLAQGVTHAKKTHTTKYNATTATGPEAVKTYSTKHNATPAATDREEARWWGRRNIPIPWWGWRCPRGACGWCPLRSPPWCGPRCAAGRTSPRGCARWFDLQQTEGNSGCYCCTDRLNTSGERRQRQTDPPTEYKNFRRTGSVALNPYTISSMVTSKIGHKWRWGGDGGGEWKGGGRVLWVEGKDCSHTQCGSSIPVKLSLM